MGSTYDMNLDTELIKLGLESFSALCSVVSVRLLMSAFFRVVCDLVVPISRYEYQLLAYAT